MQVHYRRLDKEMNGVAAASLDAKTDSQKLASSPDQYHVEHVTLFVPDVWNLSPSKETFEHLNELLKNQLESKLAALEPPPVVPTETDEKIDEVDSKADAEMTEVHDGEDVEKAEVLVRQRGSVFVSFCFIFFHVKLRHGMTVFYSTKINRCMHLETPLFTVL